MSDCQDQAGKTSPEKENADTNDMDEADSTVTQKVHSSQDTVSRLSHTQNFEKTLSVSRRKQKRFENSDIKADGVPTNSSDDRDEISSPKSQLIPKPRSSLLYNSQTSTSVENYGSFNREHRGPDFDERRNTLVRVKKSGEQHRGQRSRLCSFLLINLMLILFYSAHIFMKMALEQYIYQRTAMDVTGENSTKTASHPCLNDTGNSTETERVQEMTTLKIFLFDLVSLGLAIPACVVLGGLSKRILSRQMQLFIPVCGFVVHTVCDLAVIYWHLDLNWMYLGRACTGLTGHACAVLLGIFLYTSDITDRDKNRTIAVLIVEGSKGVVGSSVNVVAGQLIKNVGYSLPVFLATVLTTLVAIISLFLPTHKSVVTKRVSDADERSEELDSFWDTFAFPKGSFKDTRVKRMFVNLFITFGLVFTAVSGASKVTTLYLMNRPLCWSSSTIGWFNFGTDMAKNLYVMVVVPVIYPFLPGLALAILGTLSGVAGLLFLAFATNNILMYIQGIVYTCHNSVIGLMRGESSRLLGPQGQGPLFATIAVMETASFLVGTGCLYLYDATLAFFKGFVMVSCASIMVVATCLLISFQMKWVPYMREITTKQMSLEVNENDASINA